MSNTTDFLLRHVSGRLHVRASAVQQGRTQQLWRVQISRPQDGKLIAVGQARRQNVHAQPGAAGA